MNWTFCILCSAREIFSQVSRRPRSEEYYGTHAAAHGHILGLFSKTFPGGKITGKALYQGLESLGAIKRDVFVTFAALHALWGRKESA
jgi:hypothetical protein